MQAMAAKNIVPKVYYASSGESIIIIDQADNIEVTTLKVRILRTKLKEVAQKLRLLHSIDLAIVLHNIPAIKLANEQIAKVIRVVLRKHLNNFYKSLRSFNLY